MTDAEIIRAAVAAMPHTNPGVADDLLGGFTMHTEAEDIVAIWRAAEQRGAEAERARCAAICSEAAHEELARRQHYASSIAACCHIRINDGTEPRG